MCGGGCTACSMGGNCKWIFSTISLRDIVDHWTDNYHNGHGQWTVDTNNEFTHQAAKYTAKEGGEEREREGGENVLNLYSKLVSL